MANWNDKIKGGISRFCRNVVQGLRVSLLRKPHPSGFYVSARQWASLALLLVAIDAAGDRAAAGPGRVFSYYGVMSEATCLVVALIATYVAFVLLRGARITALLVSLTAVSVLSAGVNVLFLLAEDGIDSTAFATQLFIFAAWLGWLCMMTARLFKAVTSSGWWRCADVTGVYAFLSLLPAFVLPDVRFCNEPCAAARPVDPAGEPPGHRQRASPCHHPQPA